MFRARSRSETPSRPTARRGSVGSAQVWDEDTRARRAALPAHAPPEPPPAPESAPVLLPRDELAPLVAGIVQLTLDTRLADHEPARRVELARELQTRLLALFGAPAAEVASEERVLSEPSVDEPANGALPQSAGASLLPNGDATPAERALGLVLEDRLQRLGGPLAARADLRERLIVLALQRLALSSSVVESTASGEELQSLDVLQRRAAKLERSLQEARAALAYVAGLEHVDEGLASIYRAVQGLSLEDPQRESKRDALERIFRANLALQVPADEP